MNVRFGTAGIRGLTYVEVTPQLCHVASKALARFFGKGSRLALGYDTRPGAEQLAGVCASAMISEDAQVQSFGVIPSPILSQQIAERGIQGGLIVTGSHLSYDRIGLIPLDSDGTILSREKTTQIEELASRIEPPGRDLTGALPRSDLSWPPSYQRFIRAILDGDAFAGKGVSIALDPAGATGAGVVTRLLVGLGCEVAALNDERTSIAPRPMEPRADSVRDLRALVARSRKVSFGAAFDADCDRVVFMDEASTPLSEDLAAAVFARYLYDSGPGVCVMPVNSSGLMRTVWKGRVEECRIGPPEISLAIKRHKARFGYEETGKYFFPPRVLWADGIMATVFMAVILARTRRALSDIASEFPHHVQVKRNLRGQPEQMASLMEKVKERFKPPDAKLVEIDGLKYVYDDGSWLLIRLSGTEPVVRVYVDSTSPERARELSDEGVGLVKELLEARRQRRAAFSAPQGRRTASSGAAVAEAGDGPDAP